jgi:multiple sugar transport system substrate-binding protein
MQNDNYSKDKEENFNEEIGRFIKQKFPHITIEHLHKPKYEDFLTTGDLPDLILEGSSYAGTRIKEYGLATDLAEYIRTYQFDLDRINPLLLEQLRNYSGESKLFGLPFTGSNFILYSNKDLFDKFGVSYPKDGMTWEETYELAKRLARQEGDTVYVGFSAHPSLMIKYNQLSLDALDAKSNKAAVYNENWKKIFDNFKQFYDIPNNPAVHVDEFPKGRQAMVLHVSEKLTLWPQQAQSLNWDVVAAPSFKEKPKVGLQPNIYSLYVTAASKHKKEAFQVIAHLLSDEVQSYLSRKGYVVPLKDPSVQKLVGQDIAGLKGKNVANAIYFNEFAPPPPPRAANLLYVDGFSLSGSIFDNMIKTGEDVNTTLRKWEEGINKLFEAKAAQ